MYVCRAPRCHSPPRPPLSQPSAFPQSGPSPSAPGAPKLSVQSILCGALLERPTNLTPFPCHSRPSPHGPRPVDPRGGPQVSQSSPPLCGTPKYAPSELSIHEPVWDQATLSVNWRSLCLIFRRVGLTNAHRLIRTHIHMKASKKLEPLCQKPKNKHCSAVGVYIRAPGLQKPPDIM